jgi:hypothetical protein
MGGASSTFGQNQQIHIWYGDHPSGYTKLVVGDTNYIKVKLICWQNTVYIADLHIPVATNNTYISQRFTDGKFYSPLASWVEHSFLPFNTIDTMPGWKSQSIYCQRLNDNEPYLNPYYTNLIAEYKIYVVDNPNWIGDTVQSSSIIKRGRSLTLGGLALGDTLGGPGYTNIVEHYMPVIFIACRDSTQIGTGEGLTNNFKTHLDTYCNLGLNFQLKDISRRLHAPTPNNSGLMKDTASINTEIYQSSPFTGILMTDLDNYWVDNNQLAGVDAHDYTAKAYDFLRIVLQRNGFDSVGSSMNSQVENQYSGLYNNAAWYLPNKKVYYGTVPSGYRSYAACLDVVGHEWGHAITNYCSNFDYSGESGALSEAFSDMTGVYINRYWTNDPTWWLIAKNHFTNGNCLRDMQTPTNLQMPDTYLRQYWHPTSDTSDNGGVHTNCSVPDKMFFLLASDGSNIHNGIAVQGLGIDNAFKIMYYANRYRLWPTTSSFWDARNGCIRAALQIDTTTHKARNVADAWNAINVGDSCAYVPGDVNGNGEARGSDITYLTAYLKGGSPPPDSCRLPYQINGRDWFYIASDYNGDCQISGADVTWGVAYYKGFKPEIRYCPHFSPSTP